MIDKDLDRLISALEFHGRYGSETEQVAATRRIWERETAANLLRSLKTCREALRRIDENDLGDVRAVHRFSAAREIARAALSETTDV